jgi:hypothetical protein
MQMENCNLCTATFSENNLKLKNENNGVSSTSVVGLLTAQVDSTGLTSNNYIRIKGNKEGDQRKRRRICEEILKKREDREGNVGVEGNSNE